MDELKTLLGDLEKANLGKVNSFKGLTALGIIGFAIRNQAEVPVSLLEWLKEHSREDWEWVIRVKVYGLTPNYLGVKDGLCILAVLEKAVDDPETLTGFSRLKAAVQKANKQYEASLN